MSLPFPVPPSLSTGFSMSRSTAADLDAIAEIYYDAFQGDKRNTFWWPSEREAMLEWMRHRVGRKMKDRSVRHFKVTDDESGDIVAFARWDIPDGHETTFGEWVGDDAPAINLTQVATQREGPGDNPPVNSAPVEATAPPTLDYPAGSQEELCRVFFDALKDMSEKQGAKAMLGLSLLCTSPKYYRKGAAKALMLPMLALADAHGLRTYLEATSEGKPVYEKLGFREVDRLVFNLKELTGKFEEEEYTITIMVREPKSA